jgi:hypothetical protein
MFCKFKRQAKASAATANNEDIEIFGIRHQIKAVNRINEKKYFGSGIVVVVYG